MESHGKSLTDCGACNTLTKFVGPDQKKTCKIKEEELIVGVD